MNTSDAERIEQIINDLRNPANRHGILGLAAADEIARLRVDANNLECVRQAWDEFRNSGETLQDRFALGQAMENALAATAPMRAEKEDGRE